MINSDPDANVVSPSGKEAHFDMMRTLIAMLGQENGLDAAMFWRNLMRACGLTQTLAGVGLTTDRQLEDLIATINPARLGNNPVAVDPEMLLARFKYEPETDCN
jgi:hypothetical protein